jgi:predicted N-formylglutamate amidohydrolase
VIGIVLTCEHASWTLPPGLDLGVEPALLRSQAGWDHGAYDIAARLGEGLGLPVHTGAFTRLFVDLNRPADHADVVPVVCYGLAVPGNRTLSPEERAGRIAEFHKPYWDQVRRDVRARLLDRRGCLHFSLHSFSPELDPAKRTFDCGVLYDPTHAFEAALAERLMFGLAAAGLAVRANQPYGGTGPAVCTSLREELRAERYAGIELETNHTVTMSPGGCGRVAAAVLPILEAIRDGE